MLKPWYSVAVPHRDIREGRMDESVFAASLSDVVAGRGALEYLDAATFFQKTYPTQGLLNLLGAVVGRLAGTGYGEPVIQLQTPFGGGKTHVLVALYHLLRSPEALAGADMIQQILERSGAGALPKGRVVVFDGTAADPVKGKTPWGEIAAQLGRYELLREQDQARRAPGKDRLHEVLAGGPVLILMDEVAEYAVKARDFRDQVMAFFQELTETVKVAERCALVVTLPSSAPYGEEGEHVLAQLQQIIGRVEALYAPVEGDEVFEVIRRRLFESVGTPREAQQVAEAYWQLYQRLGEDVPAEARNPAYRERLRRAYPFHPQVIDLLYERWSTFPTFQRTRGVLRLLAHVVLDLYRSKRHAAPLIQAAHLNLANSAIRREFVKHIGNEFEGVIAADIVDSNAKAQRIDQEIGSEYARFGVASGLATAIFFGSFSGSERKGITVPQLRLALLHEEIPPAIVGDALHRLEEELWYLHVEGGLYQFRNTPNLNRVLLEREEGVKDDEIAEEIRTQLERLAGKEMRVFLFPSASGDIPDNRELKLAILSGEYPAGAKAEPLARELLTRAGLAYRAYRNTLLILAPAGEAFQGLRAGVRRVLALRRIHADKRLWQTLIEDDRRSVEGRLKDAEGGLAHQVLSAYRHLARASEEGEGGIKWLDLGLAVVGMQASLAKRVYDFLKSQDMLLEKLAPRYILEKAFRPEEREKPLADVREAFLRYPNLPILANDTVLTQAVMQGVKGGVFGVRSGGRLWFGEQQEDHALMEIAEDAVLVRPEVAREERAKGKSAQPKGETEGSTGGSTSGGGGIPPQPTGDDTVIPPVITPKAVHHVRLRVLLPWEKVSDFTRGVIVPLEKDARLTVEVTVEACSETGIPQDTLAYSVEETLRQIGAKILENTQE